MTSMLSSLASGFASAFNTRAKEQLSELQKMVAKRMPDTDLNTYTLTSLERDIPCYDYIHLVTALDNLNSYQKMRSAVGCSYGSMRMGLSKTYETDPRTKIIELLKAWLRNNANNASLSETDVKKVHDLCGDILIHPKLFPARNATSFLHVIADVKGHLEWQLKDVLKRDRTCSELAKEVLKLGRNLVSDVIGFLLLAPTDLRQTDSMPSTEIVQLWQSLPDEGHPIPSRTDRKMQKTMADAWSTHCGSLVAAVLTTPCALRLFDAAGSAEEDQANRAREQETADANGGMLLDASPGTDRQGWRASMRSAAASIVTRTDDKNGSPASSAPVSYAPAGELVPMGFKPQLEVVKMRFARGDFAHCGLAGALRLPKQAGARNAYLDAIQVVFDLMYLLGEAFVHFHRIGDNLGDYGMICVAQWLHPFLDALSDKVQQLKNLCGQVNTAVENLYVVARAKGQPIQKPAPSEKMCAAARSCFERAFRQVDGHHDRLLKIIKDLRDRSAASRLPRVFGELGTAMTSLKAVLGSAEFKESIGAQKFPMIEEITGEGARVEALAAPPAGTLVAIEDLESPKSAPANAAPAPARLGQGTNLRAEVTRMVPSSRSSSLKAHDKRNLMLSGGTLYIFESGSSSTIKHEINVATDVDEVVAELSLMTLKTRRKVAGGKAGAIENKEYVFEFPTAELATRFCHQMTPVGRLRE